MPAAQDPAAERPAAHAGIAVVIPTKNRAGLLQEALRTVAAQTLPPAEVIVADDGSTDRTAQVAEEFKVRYLPNPHGNWGAAGARNAALQLAKADYVAFIDSDDLYRPNALAKLSAALDRQPGAPFAYGQALAARRSEDHWFSAGLIAPTARELNNFAGSLYVRNMVPLSATMARRNAILEVGGFDSTMTLSEDHALWLALVKRFGPPAYVDEVVSVHRRHGGNSMSPLHAMATLQRITELALTDSQLHSYLPARLGVQLSEVALDSLHARRPEGIRIAASQLLRGPSRAGIIRSAVRFVLQRRALGDQGAELLRTDADLHRWLDHHK